MAVDTGQTQTAGSERLAAPGPSWSTKGARRLLRSGPFLAGAVITGVWLLCAVGASLIAPYDPLKVDLASSLTPPSASHWLGTDKLGRDVLSRVIAGSRQIIGIALLAASCAMVLGAALGLLMGFLRGMTDIVLSRIGEAVISLPGMILALLVVTALGPSFLTLVVAIGFADSWVIARTVRSAVLSEREQAYVAAARVRGEGRAYIMALELLPNVLPVIVVEFTARIALAAFTLASLSFLGFGVQPPAPAWGLQISQHYTLLAAGSWWPVVFPALAIISFVVGIYLAANAAQEVLDQ